MDQMRMLYQEKIGRQAKELDIVVRVNDGLKRDKEKTKEQIRQL